MVQGSLEMQDGVIRSFTDGPSRLPQALDGDGGWLLPGLIELHTDNRTSSSPRVRTLTGRPIRR